MCYHLCPFIAKFFPTASELILPTGLIGRSILLSLLELNIIIHFRAHYLISPITPPLKSHQCSLKERPHFVIVKHCICSLRETRARVRYKDTMGLHIISI